MQPFFRPPKMEGHKFSRTFRDSLELSGNPSHDPSPPGKLHNAVSISIQTCEYQVAGRSSGSAKSRGFVPGREAVQRGPLTWPSPDRGIRHALDRVSKALQRRL